MRRVGLGLLLAFLVLGALLIPPGTAQATRPQPIETTLTITSAVPTSFREAGGNLFVTLASTATLSGDLDGTLIYEIDVIIHPTGNGNHRVRGTFEGTVNGQWGTATLDAQGTIESGAQSGQWVMERGTGGLAGVHIQGTFEGPLGGPITLSGWMHFDP